MRESLLLLRYKKTFQSLEPEHRYGCFGSFA
nr:MAG TPA: hypothetical protein [Myoviridae sp. cttWQ44]